jgi:hypothetical protein
MFYFHPAGWALRFMHVMYSVFIECWGNIRTQKVALNTKALLLPRSPDRTRLQLVERLAWNKMKQQL